MGDRVEHVYFSIPLLYQGTCSHFSFLGICMAIGAGVILSFHFPNKYPSKYMIFSVC